MAVLGKLDKTVFDPNRNYDEFYAGHKFEPLPEPLCYNADTVIPRVGWALDVAQEIDAQHVLDLGCLDGFAGLTLADKLGVDVLGVDLSEPGVQLANERALKKVLPARFECASVESMKTGYKADLILLFETIEHFKDVDTATAIIKSHLKPGGTLLVSTPDAEGHYGFGNYDTCHLRIYSHRSADDLPVDTSPITKDKPVISLADYLKSQGFEVVENMVWNDLVHVRACA